MIIISYKWTYGLSGNDYIVATFFIGSDGWTYVQMDLQTDGLTLVIEKLSF